MFWDDFNTGLPVAAGITALTTDGIYIYSSTRTKGVWKRLIADIVGNKNPLFANKNMSISSNPTDGKFNLFLNENSFKTEDILIYNLMGEKILPLYSVKQGTNQIVIDISNQPAGIYVLKLRNQQQSLSEIIIKQ